MPDGVARPDELAFWLAALINPLPVLGVSPEVRPAVLQVCIGLWCVLKWCV
jgi:hypothetical protein